MRLLLATISLALLVSLFCACNSDPLPKAMPLPTPTAGVLADTFFFGCAYLDANSDGSMDPDDQPVNNALFTVNSKSGLGFGGASDANGCATIVVPGGLDKKSWPVTASMEPPEDTGYELVSPAKVVLMHPATHADFLFVDPGESR